MLLVARVKKEQSLNDLQELVISTQTIMIQCRQIDCEQIRSRINQQLIAGRFGHEGLCILLHICSQSIRLH